MRTLPLLLLVSACAAPASRPAPEPSRAPAPSEERIPETIVRLSAVADVNRVNPGQELTVAALLEIEPGWHVYWQYPGDTGQGTVARIDAPPPFVVGNLRYPGPERLELGDKTAFGYTTRAVLSARITAPDQLSGESRFVVAARWLACKGKVCVPGRGEAELALETAGPASPSAPSNQILFADHESRLPKPLANLANARHDWHAHDDSAELVLYVDGGAQVEFYPTKELAAQLTGQAMVPGRGVGALHLSFRGQGPERVRGVMMAADGTTTHFFELDLPGPGHTTASN